MGLTNTLLPFLYNNNYRNVCVIGHRGFSLTAPENTMESFRQAFHAGANMIEFDVQLSLDGIPVVIHDEVLSRTTDGKGSVSSHTFTELRELDAGSWFSPEFKNEKIPSLEDVLKWAKGKIALNIEIKSSAANDSEVDGIEHRVVSLVEKYGMINHTLFSSFDTRAIIRIKKNTPEAFTGVLYGKQVRYILHPEKLVQQTNANLFHCRYNQLSKYWLNRLQKNNIPVFVYTVNSKRKMKYLIKNGVSGIFTDNPALLTHILNTELT